MSTVTGGPQIVRTGLVLDLDASSANSYGPIKAEVLVVAGGGGGGMDMGGGGGGGGVLYSSSYAITRGSTITVTVGNGGTGAPAAGTNGQPGGHQYTISATQGGNSVFGSLTAIGGGYGGSSYFGYTPNNGYGSNGGSGGGASGYSDGSAGRAGTGTSGQGFNGGGSSGQYYSGGGGGAGGAGVSGPNKPNGGPGVLYPTMSQYYFGGGGGGASYTLSSGGDGGIGGGGGGAVGVTVGGAGLNNGSAGGGGSPNSQTNTPGGNAGANTGGGGGGGSHYSSNNKGGNGGSGIVIIRYKGPQKATGGTITTVGTETVHTFTSSGTFVTGAFFIDLSGNGNNGTINGPTFSTTNKGAIVFDGVDDYIDLNSNNIITGINPFTFEAFYKLSGAGNAELFGNYGSGYSTNYIWISGRYGLFINGGYPYFQGYPLPTGTYHMAVTRDSAGTCSLYKNGVLDGTATNTVSIPVGLNFRIGSDVNGLAELLNGEIYSMRVYNRTLSATEIFNNFQATKTRFGL